MDRHQIARLLTDNHAAFIRDLNSLPPSAVHTSIGGKWTPAQQAAHIVKSVAPVRLAFRLPSWILKLMFGTSNRPTRSYDEVVAKYKKKLAEGGVSTSQFIPPQGPDMAQQLIRLEGLVQSLTRSVESTNESTLDRLILPHPLLGKMTLREMLYFTAYHVSHHHQQVKPS